MKRTFALLLALVMVFGMLPTISFAAEANLPQSDGNPMRMWYDEPAPLTGMGYNPARPTRADSSWWQEETLPLGNGTLTLMDQRQLVDFAVDWIQQERSAP